MLDSLFTGVKATLTPLEPLLANFIFASAAIFIIKMLSRKIHDFLCFEESARERKKSHKRIDNIVDFISNIIDLISNSKPNDKYK